MAKKPNLLYCLGSILGFQLTWTRQPLFLLVVKAAFLSLLLCRICYRSFKCLCFHPAYQETRDRTNLMKQDVIMGQFSTRRCSLRSGSSFTQSTVVQWGNRFNCTVENHLWNAQNVIGDKHHCSIFFFSPSWDPSLSFLKWLLLEHLEQESIWKALTDEEQWVQFNKSSVCWLVWFSFCLADTNKGVMLEEVKVRVGNKGAEGLCE